MLKLVLPLCLLATPAAALAQASECRLPAQIARPHIEGPTAEEPRRVLPIGSYTLAISWSPQYCAGPAGRKDDFQCSGRHGRFGFTLHGLWPDGYGKQWPQYCKPAAPLSRKLIQQHLCSTPSVQLIQHEWVKHGTCMPTTPDRFFALSRRHYQALRYPDMKVLARRPALTARAFAEAFAAENKGLTADMMRVTATRDNWLSEVWLCMDRKLRYTRCPAHQGGVKPGTMLRIAPPA
ncbi:ribonuclease T2 family protein [Sphingobium chungbukense]|uniref:Ribonuclease T n=1 Tax=Sphingobium chungbukense TaxID=56193 RepID=A0A0M3AWP2_9SPHN|nr:ribonuclease T [Sphingobium chungbukense]KKW93346.1 ribonuclease T [Sphingobium chungbukense]